jgi:hypothetical protein
MGWASESLAEDVVRYVDAFYEDANACTGQPDWKKILRAKPLERQDHNETKARGKDYSEVLAVKYHRVSSTPTVMSINSKYIIDIMLK